MSLVVAFPAWGGFGLEWPGDGGGNSPIRRMLYWNNPQSNGLPIFDATYIFRVYPREKQLPSSCFILSGSCFDNYWTTFFWGNNGDFQWGGMANARSCQQGVGLAACTGGTCTAGVCVGGGQAGQACNGLPCTFGTTTCPGNGYCTAVFNNGGTTGTYYGAHPYPGCGGGASGISPQAWEVSTNSTDCMQLDGGTACGEASCVEATWDRWYTQAFTARAVDANTFSMTFYFDLEACSPGSCPANKRITYNFDSGAYATTPPFPALMMGQASALYNQFWGAPNPRSWGAKLGLEEFSGIIRGIQIYSDDLSLTDIQSEVATPGLVAGAAGTQTLWYLNLDPRPTDVTDKKGFGTSHNPLWVCNGSDVSPTCTSVVEWTDGLGGSAPTSLRPGASLTEGAKLR